MERLKEKESNLLQKISYEKNLKGKKGITLIALVVTIIVLLILAGISIAMLTGENGILGRASEAETKTTHQQVWELLNLYAIDCQMQQNLDEYEGSLIEYLLGEGYIKSTSIDNVYTIDVEKVTGAKKRYGNGTDGEKDVYKLEEVTSDSTSKRYKATYCGKKESENVELGFLIDSYEDEAEANLIHFTVSGTKCKAEPEMTWEDWIKSSYYDFSLNMKLDESGYEYPYRYVFQGTWNEEADVLKQERFRRLYV